MKSEENRKNEINPENFPNLPGIRFRGFRGDEDYPAMVEVRNSAKIADDLDQTFTVEDTKNWYSHLSRCDPLKDMLFAEVDGEVIAYGRVDWDEELNSDRLYNIALFVKPDWRTDQLGNAMIEYFTAHLKKIASTHPAENPKYFQVWANEKETWLRNLFEALGYSPVRYLFQMKRLCSEPVEVLSLPKGIEVRPIGEEDIRKVWEADSEAFKDHWGYVEPTEKNYQGWLKSPTFNPELWKVAWEGDEVTGMVLNYVDKKANEEFKRLRGYTEDISVRRPWRRRGIASALLTQSIKMFQDMGMEETVLYVDTENPSGALKLYQDVGYKEVKRSMVYRKKFN